MAKDNERKSVTETVFYNDGIYGSIIDNNNYENDKVVDFIEFLQETLESIPPEYRSNAEIDIDSVGGWEGEHHSELTITYSRPETDAEMQERLASYERERLQRENNERGALAALKAKYEPTTK